MTTISRSFHPTSLGHWCNSNRRKKGCVRRRGCSCSCSNFRHCSSSSNNSLRTFSKLNIVPFNYKKFRVTSHKVIKLSVLPFIVVPMKRCKHLSQPIWQR
uniref:Uncharacterized protein n=1 Tax=Opuntia streptacantha TaxID=393608 RepID=A0A7C9CKS5_OPUST